ncbi:MAG: ADP-ribosylglycohydrolase family protein, partial [Ruminococcus sp.]|nr:ADP-ribosylglycohydrolase family protein [Ruminococcus sp.]
VIDTLEAVLWTFFHADGYRDTILKAINLGGDTDTIAAIAGGIAGIYYGINDIPPKWLQSIVKKEELYQMFEQFCVVTDF